MTQRTTIYLQGMTCQLCANRVEKCLLSQPGVETARVDFGSRKAEVTYDPEKGLPEVFCAAIGQTALCRWPDERFYALRPHCVLWRAKIRRVAFGYPGVYRLRGRRAEAAGRVRFADYLGPAGGIHRGAEVCGCVFQRGKRDQKPGEGGRGAVGPLWGPGCAAAPAGCSGYLRSPAADGVPCHAPGRGGGGCAGESLAGRAEAD